MAGPAMKKLPGIKAARLALGALVVGLLVAFGRVALAQAPAASVSASPSPPLTEAQVSLNNRRIVVFRGSYLGVTAADRALHTTERLEHVLDHLGAGKITVTAAAGVNAILVDGALGIFVTPEDVDAIDGETLDQTTKAAASALSLVIAETREARDRQRLGRALVATSIATFALLVLVFLVLRARSWFEKRFNQLLGAERTTRVPGVIGWRSLYLERLLWLVHWIVQTAAACLLLLATYRYASFVLNQFPYTRPWGEGLDDFLLGAATQIGGGVVHALPDLLVALVIFLLARGLIAVVRPLFDSVAQRHAGRGWLDADTAKPTRRLFSLAVWLFATVMAYPYLPGSSSEAFKGISVLIGLMVTLGGSSLFGQAASGLILLYSRTLRLGEFVRIGEYEGTVTELGVFMTRISTGFGEDLTLPNAWVLGTATTNYSRPTEGRGYMLRVKVTIGYDAPWRQVEAMLLEAALATEGVSDEPPPHVYVTSLSDFYVEYQLVCRATQELAGARALALAALNTNVVDTFNRYGVQIMSPHYWGDPSHPKTVPVERWRPAPVAPAPVPPASERGKDGAAD
jgi:small-conductance mechanosensitive channel